MVHDGFGSRVKRARRADLTGKGVVALDDPMGRPEKRGRKPKSHQSANMQRGGLPAGLGNTQKRPAKLLVARGRQGGAIFIISAAFGLFPVSLDE